MPARTVTRPFAVCAALALLAGCGGSGADGSGTSGGNASAARAPDVVPTKSRPPKPGRGSADPDDINGDGHRDLLMKAAVPSPGQQGGPPPAVAVVFGSARGLDPTTRTVYTSRELGLPAAEPPSTEAPLPDTTADLDDDGFPDFVTRGGEDVPAQERGPSGLAQRGVEYVTWGGPAGPRRAGAATRLRLPAQDAAEGYSGTVRGDFDGDGRHDLAGLRADGTSVALLFGPFSRAGAAARTERRPLADAGPASYGTLSADEPPAAGKPRTTGVYVHYGNDGEQSAGEYFAARSDGGLAATSRTVRKGNGHAFGDFDGDGTRDLAVGDDGERNDEPGASKESADVHGSYAVYPGGDGTVRTYRVPRIARLGSYTAVDPDGDGRDALLRDHPRTPVLIDRDRRTGRLVRKPPARVDGMRVPAASGWKQVHAAADFDSDGKDEVVLSWTWTKLQGTYGSTPTHWWLTDGVSARDDAVFSSRKFAPRA
ncbi:hypothetical protein [Streptomyces flavofungini]|uniref:Integrin n=1 Tax=Streptomyces flavofungini TaxID=68200 RepID=A0ABS0X8E8_9ACTN|nr:hypothetical protein [Streptomyces flavofungini]MBJ3809488.1 hypothetical protein [Streptomyces flavofungini]GHC55044.1 hypothetical protein GCM10010349_21520 [Streptomyces flavofungini]